MWESMKFVCEVKNIFEMKWIIYHEWNQINDVVSYGVSIVFGITHLHNLLNLYTSYNTFLYTYQCLLLRFHALLSVLSNPLSSLLFVGSVIFYIHLGRFPILRIFRICISQKRKNWNKTTPYIISRSPLFLQNINTKNSSLEWRVKEKSYNATDIWMPHFSHKAHN